MKTNKKHITIGDNINHIQKFIRNVIIKPRLEMLKWSATTNQTPSVKIGYVAQHLASLITGVKGTATGARGDDLADKTEVKSCSRIDPLDKCKQCKGNVLRSQIKCPSCGSKEILRTNDSKWLISIRSEDELRLHTEEIPRTLFIIFDYPCFCQGDYNTMRISAYEIWNQSERACNYRQLLEDYYHNIYLAHIEKNPSKTPAPKDFWPYSYQFYMCNPIKTFECLIHNINGATPKIEIPLYIQPEIDRASLPSEQMPIEVLKKSEIKQVLKAFPTDQDLEYIDERQRSALSLRPTSKASPQKSKYHRGK